MKKFRVLFLMIASLLLVFSLPSFGAEILSFNLDELWWNIADSLLGVIDMMQQAYEFLVGVKPLTNAGAGGESENSNFLLLSLFNGVGEGNGVLFRAYACVALGAVVFMLIFVAIQSVKSQFTKDANASMTEMGSKTLFAALKMLLIPVVFMLALYCTTYIIEWLRLSVTSAGSNTSLAQALCDACSGRKPGEISPGKNFEENEALFANFNYMLCILSACFVIWTMATVAISLTKRIIEVFWYYLMSPVAVCKTPLDDGKSFESWKDSVIAKLLSAGGIMIAMYLYMMILPQFITIVDGNTGMTDTVKNAIKILFVLGGSAVPASAPMMMASLVSQNAGQNEANNMMHTQQMMGNALRMASGITTKAMLGATMAASGLIGGGIKNIASKFGGGSSSGSSGAAAVSALAAEGGKKINAAPETLGGGGDGGGDAAPASAAAEGAAGQGGGQFTAPATAQPAASAVSGSAPAAASAAAAPATAAQQSGGDSQSGAAAPASQPQQKGIWREMLGRTGKNFANAGKRLGNTKVSLVTGIPGAIASGAVSVAAAGWGALTAIPRAIAVTAASRWWKGRKQKKNTGLNGDIRQTYAAQQQTKKTGTAQSQTGAGRIAKAVEQKNDAQADRLLAQQFATFERRFRGANGAFDKGRGKKIHADEATRSGLVRKNLEQDYQALQASVAARGNGIGEGAQKRWANIQNAWQNGGATPKPPKKGNE